jgi:hypothetical protein
VLGEVVNHTLVGASVVDTSSGELRNRGDLLERHAWIATPAEPGGRRSIVAADAA